MKPVASGAERTGEGLRNEDAVRILQQAFRAEDYDLVNPFAFAPPVAPHLAARQVGVDIDFARIITCCDQLGSRADMVMVEGVGGWRVPLGAGQTLSDLAEALAFPVILVVGLKLGCINHALLTVESIISSELKLAGWVANVSDPGMLEMSGNLETLKHHINAPLLGYVPRLASPTADAVAACLDLP